MSYNNAVNAIDKCLADGGTWLDLSGHGLTGVPLQIGRRTHLTSLELSENCLKEVPPEIWSFTGLEALAHDWRQLNANSYYEIRPNGPNKSQVVQEMEGLSECVPNLPRM